VNTVLQSHCLTLLNDFEKYFSFNLVKKFDFDPDPESDAEIPVKWNPDFDPEFPSKSDPDPEIIFLHPTHSTAV